MTLARRRSATQIFDVPRNAVRFFSIVGFVLLLGIPSARVIERNISVSHQVSEEDQVIKGLEDAKRLQLRAIARLQRPDGAIPEIHNRLKYAADNEAVVFVRRPGDGMNAIVGP